MSNPAGSSNALVEQVADLWQRAAARRDLAPGDAFTVHVHGGAVAMNDSAIQLLKDALVKRGFTVGRTTSAGDVFTVTRVNLFAAPAARGGNAHGAAQWTGSATGASDAPTSSREELLADIFDMLAVIAKQGQSSTVSPELVIALLSLLVSLLPYLGYPAP